MPPLRGRKDRGRTRLAAPPPEDAGFSVLPVAYAVAVLMLVVAFALLRALVEVTRP